MANMQPPQRHSSDLTSPQTTFVQADPSNFRTIVQKLTGASDDPSAQKLPVTVHSRPKPPAAAATDMGPRKPPPFKLHERRHRKLDQIQLSHPANRSYMVFSSEPHRLSPSSSSPSRPSPVSPLDLFARGSPRSTLPQSLLSPPPLPPSDEEERAVIAEKGFYLHPSPRRVTPRAAAPELLPLFPLQSPRDNDHRS